MSLQKDDLMGVVNNNITIDKFEPKSGNTEEVIVVAFYARNEQAANDLNTFIQRGFIDILDAEVSPNTDEEGNYVTFVEMPRNDMFEETFLKMLDDIENVTSRQDWKVRPYLADHDFEVKDPALFKWIITDPGDYQDKMEFKQAKANESLRHDSLHNYISDSWLNGITLHENSVIFNNKIIANIVDFGDAHSTMERHSLSESVVTCLDVPREVIALENELGTGWHVNQLEDKIVVNSDTSDNILILNGLEFYY